MEFADWELDIIWGRAYEVDGFDREKYRQDACGAWIQRYNYGRITSGEHPLSTKWNVDHVVARAREGPDDLGNYMPLQWYNNQMKADGPLRRHVTSYRAENVEGDGVLVEYP